MTPSQAFRNKLHEIIQEVMEEDDVWKTCINCAKFNAEKELCGLCTPPSRPPARVIAFGCPAFMEADKQSGPLVEQPKNTTVPRRPSGFTASDYDDVIPF